MGSIEVSCNIICVTLAATEDDSPLATGRRASTLPGASKAVILEEEPDSPVLSEPSNVEAEPDSTEFLAGFGNTSKMIC